MRNVLRKLLRRLFDNLGAVCLKIGRNIDPRPMERRAAPWFQDKGDSTYRLLYPLDASSVVFDLGGYEGQWAGEIYARYCCRIHIFEPVAEYAENICRRFAKNPQMIVHPYGLGAAAAEIRIGLGADGSSAFKETGQAETGRLVEAETFFREQGITEIDLMKINIEGGEYDLLEHLLETGWVARIQNLQVQFHDFVPNAEARMRAIQKRLSETHSLTYQYEFVWENWQAK